MSEKEICWNITTKCNQKCKYCHRFLNVREVSLEQNKKILQDLIDSNVGEITWTGGEALLYDGINYLLETACEKGIKNKLITNGKALTNDVIDEIIPYLDNLTLSLDSINNDTNALLERGRDHFDNIDRVLKYISDKKYNVKISINTVISRVNLNELSSLIEYLNKFNIYSWRIFKFMPLREKALKNKKMLSITDEEFWCEYNLIEKLSNIKKIESRKTINMEREYILILADGSITVTKNGNDYIVGNALAENISNSSIKDKKSWLEVYKKDISKHKNLDNYINYKIKNKKVFIDLIKKYAQNKRIIEVGSGTGILSTYMAGIGFNVTTIDIDKDILKLSKQIAEEYKSVNKPIFQIKSIFKLNYKKETFDVCMSNGVLEHFTDEEIIETLKQQMKIASVVIFGIPTQYFKMSEAMYGDERYLSLDYWRHLIFKADGIILEEKSMKYFTLGERILKFNKYFKPAPFRIFVVKQKSL